MRSTSSPELTEMTAAAPPKADLGNLLARDEYVRHRLQPRLRDADYLSLNDLHQVVARLAELVEGRIFDYGCGAAPYRSLFRRGCEYVAADVTPGPNVDRLLGPDGLTTEPSGSYDVVLSTQVLEHVKDPVRYLRECARLLRPGGQLFLSTHGMIEEHACPDDYYRWTSRGLEALLISQGWRVLESDKFTAELRAIVQLAHQFVDHFRAPNRPVWRVPLALVRRVYHWLWVPSLNWLADRFPHQAIVPASHPASLYVGICVRAERPPGGGG